MTTQSQFGGPPERPRRTRADRFRVIRDAIMAQFNRMKPTYGPSPAGWEMRCGPFLIHLSAPAVFGPGYNLDIWPAGVIDGGHLVLGPKVVNVNWDQRDNVDIVTFRSGPWEDELLSLLRNEGNIRPFS